MVNFFLLVVSLSASCRGQDTGNGMQSGHGMQIGDGIIPEVWVDAATEQFSAAVQQAQQTLVEQVVSGTVQQTPSTNQVSDSSKFLISVLRRVNY